MDHQAAKFHSASWFQRSVDMQFCILSQWDWWLETVTVPPVSLLFLLLYHYCEEKDTMFSRAKHLCPKHWSHPSLLLKDKDLGIICRDSRCIKLPKTSETARETESYSEFHRADHGRSGQRQLWWSLGSEGRFLHFWRINLCCFLW